MEDVTDNHDAASLQRFWHGVLRGEMPSKGEQIQKTLTGMAVETITPIEHHSAPTDLLQVQRQLLRHSGGTVAHHQNVGPHGHVDARRVEIAFSFAE